MTEEEIDKIVVPAMRQILGKRIGGWSIAIGLLIAAFQLSDRLTEPAVAGATNRIAVTQNTKKLVEIEKSTHEQAAMVNAQLASVQEHMTDVERQMATIASILERMTHQQQTDKRELREDVSELRKLILQRVN